MEHSTWLSSSLIYLSAAVLAVPLSRALGLGSILGYLGAGIAIGPWGLALVTQGADILQFAEFGVVLMLFLVGLELEPKRLWALRRAIFLWGSVQVLGCAVLLYLLARLAGLPWTLAVVAALGLALSSTAVALQVLGERNQLRTSSGQAAFAILLFQDVAAIPILALLPLLAGFNEGNWASGRMDVALPAIKIVAIMVAVLLLGRLVLRPLLRWIAGSRTPEIFTAASLLLVVATALLMQRLGLSMALGAFLAGVLLAESEYRRELETNIEPFKGLLLGLFFIAVGMGMDFGVLARQPLQMLAIVCAFLAVKALLVYGMALRQQLAPQERPVYTLLLAQGGEFAFVVFQAAAAARVLSADTTALLVGAVALSMLLTPLLLLAIDKLLLPRYARCGVPQLDEISEPQEAPVLIAGFGRYGQIVARVLLAQGHACTVLDHDAEMIEAARRFGYRVFYGDATRLDLLRTAGAAQAHILVVAVDDVQQSLAIVDLARAHFPQAELLARARDVTHWNQLTERGVRRIERELFESSLASARSALECLGHAPDAAAHIAQRFRQHNLALLQQLHPHYQDRAKLISVVKQARAQLEEQFASERARDAGLPPLL